MSDELSLAYEIRAAVNGQQIKAVEATDALIPAAASADGAQGADTLEILFQQGRIVIEVPAGSTLLLSRCLLLAWSKPSGHLDEN